MRTVRRPRCSTARRRKTDMTLDEMLKTDGIFIITTNYEVTVVEVVGDEVFSLDYRNLERDNSLTREGWQENSIIFIIGPLFREPFPRPR